MLNSATLAVAAAYPRVDGSRPCYTIQLYTSVRDEATALDLAAQISRGLRFVPEVYEHSTTVELEGAPESQRPVYVEVVTAGPTR